MAQFNKLAPLSKAAMFGSVATNASSVLAMGAVPLIAEVIACRVVNSGGAAVTSGTTTGSAVTITVYKNASSAGSVVGSFNGSGTSIATFATQTMALSGTVNTRMAAGDRLFAEYTGGVANNASNAGLVVEADIVYGYYDGVNPAAATGPA